MKRCRHCRKQFEPKRSTLETCCGPACAIAYARQATPTRLAADLRKARVSEKREAKARLMPISQLKNRVQQTVNRYVRLRDEACGCISCSAPMNYDGQWTAGHFRTRAAADHLRFNEDNLAKQCGQCNYHKSGNIPAFRLGLVARIGVVRVEALENDNRAHKWTREELHEIRRTYLEKWKALKAEREARAAA